MLRSDSDYDSEPDVRGVPAPPATKPWRTPESDLAREELSGKVRGLYNAAIKEAYEREINGQINKQERKALEKSIAAHYTPIWEKINSTYDMPELDARATFLEVNQNIEPNELKRQEGERAISHQREVSQSLERQKAQEQSMALAQSESDARARALQQERAVSEAEWRAKEQHRAQSQAESSSKSRAMSELDARERDRAQSASELGEKSRHHSELDSKHYHERDAQEREIERNLQEIREALRAEKERKQHLMEQEESKVRSEERFNDMSSQASRAGQIQSEMEQFRRPSAQAFQSASQAFQPERVFPSRLDSEEYARSQTPRPSSHGLAMAEAEARAREFANMPRASASAPRAPDPNVPSSHTNLDPERASLNAEIMSRAHQFLKTPPLPSTPLDERFAFHNEHELQPLLMARQYGVQNPHYEKAREQAELTHERLPEGIHRYMNPYHQHVVDRIAEEGNRNLFEHILPTLESRYIKLGQHGGMRHHNLGARAVRDVQKEISAMQGQALASGYENAAQHFNTDMARQLEASKMHTALGQQNQASRLSDMAALRDAESESRAFRQGLKDYKQHELERVHKHPQEQLNAYSQLAQGNPYSTSTHHYKPSVPQSMHRNNWQDYAVRTAANATREFGGPLLGQALRVFGGGS